MIQLTFQPAFDSFHTMFRMLQLREGVLETTQLPIDHFRILDFYLLFPSRLEEMTFKKEHSKLRIVARKYSEVAPYESQPPANSLFGQMEIFQSNALQSLAVAELFDGSALRDSLLVKRGNAAIPAALEERLKQLAEEKKDLMEALKVLATQYSLIGIGGLKERTGLMEHRYDAA